MLSTIDQELRPPRSAFECEQRVRAKPPSLLRPQLAVRRTGYGNPHPSFTHPADRWPSLGRKLGTAHEELERLYALLRPIGFIAAVADPSGVIVYRCCHASDEGAFDSLGMLAGTHWTEDAAGSNGIGCSLAERRPACIKGEQHMSLNPQEIISIGVPFFDASGELLGSLGVLARANAATEAAATVAFSITVDWARAIEERLFRDAYSHAWILAVDLDEGRQSRCLLAVDDNQVLLGADRFAREAFGFTAQTIRSGVNLAQRLGHLPIPGKQTSSQGDSRLCLQLQERPGVLMALMSVPVAAWSNEELRQYRTRPRVAMLSRPSPPLPEISRSGALAPNILAAIQRYISAHLAETISVAALAHQAGYSRNYFLSAFSKSTGLTPHRYIVQQRNAKAAEMLSDTDMDLADIALTVGFADQSHFTRSFSRSMECTPSAFRRRRRHAGTAPTTMDRKHQYPRI